MTPAERSDYRLEEAARERVEALEASHREYLHESGDHAERRDEDCIACEADLADATAEHAWMTSVVRTYGGGNPYASDRENREGDPAFNGAFDRW